MKAMDATEERVLTETLDHFVSTGFMTPGEAATDDARTFAQGTAMYQWGLLHARLCELVRTIVKSLPRPLRRVLEP